MSDPKRFLSVASNEVMPRFIICVHRCLSVVSDPFSPPSVFFGFSRALRLASPPIEIPFCALQRHPPGVIMTFVM